uniref:Methyltransferase n=1 Tax=viral metagenome TaxID=1070528 RepID=A0A6C0BL00_9ZZZZ
MVFEIIQADSLIWLQQQKPHSLNNVVTGIPDMNELGPTTTLEQYLRFFRQIARLIFERVKPDGYCIFIQTDRRIEGQLIDKSFLLTEMAYQSGLRLIWHKIVCQRDVGHTDLHRPTYSHFLCYSVRGKPGAAFPDVLPVSTKLYDNATPSGGAQAAITYVAKQLHTQTPTRCPYDVIDPFVGRGTIGVYALQSGLTFLGIDLDPQQCEAARKLCLSKGNARKN